MASDLLLQRQKSASPAVSTPKLDQAGLCAVSALLSGLATFGVCAWRSRGQHKPVSLLLQRMPARAHLESEVHVVDFQASTGYQAFAVRCISCEVQYCDL